MKKGGKAINPIVRFMIYSDFLVIGATGFFMPLFAVFVTKSIPGATLETVGLSVTLYWVVKSLLQLPIARYVDSVKGEADDFYLMFLGTVLFGLTQLGYLFAAESWHIFLIQGLSGMWAAFLFPTYAAIFTRHIDRHREGYEWSLHSLFVGFGYAGAAGLGGWVADRYGFQLIITLNSMLTIGGAMLLLVVKHDIIRDGVAHQPDAREPDRNGRRAT